MPPPRNPLVYLLLTRCAFALEVTIYHTGTTPAAHPSASGTLAVLAGTPYLVEVEILREDLQTYDKYVSSIRVGDSTGTDMVDLGACNPDGGAHDCTFYKCNGAAITKFTPTTSEMRFEVDMVGQRQQCNCDLNTWECSQATTGDSARTRLRLWA